MLIQLLKDLQAGKTQEEFARELGISQPALSQIYGGDRGIGGRVARCIVKRYPYLQEAVGDFLLANAGQRKKDQEVA